MLVVKTPEPTDDFGTKHPPELTQAKGFRANLGQDTGEVLGIVSDEYEVVDNRDALRFLDALTGSDPHFETAGSPTRRPKLQMPRRAPVSLLRLPGLGCERDRDAQPLERPDAEPVGHPGQVVGHTMLECAGRDRVGDCRCSSGRLWPASPATSDR